MTQGCEFFLVKFSDEQGDWWLQDRPEFRYFSDSYRDAHVFRCRAAALAAQESVKARIVGRRKVRVVTFRSMEAE